jgi:hypothetical protein
VNDVSEYGTGFIYNLVLFVKHHDRLKELLSTYQKIGFNDDAYEMWFNGAGDHFFGLKVPPQ